MKLRRRHSLLALSSSQTHRNSSDLAMAVNHNIHLLQAPSLSSSALMTTIFFLSITTITPAAAQLSFNYNGFRNSEVNLTPDAFINAESYIQLTAVEQGNNFTDSVGRVAYSELIQIWDKSSRNLTDFTTEFSFRISAEEQPYADGMAFFLAQPNLPLQKDLTHGGGLGISPSPSNNNNQTYNSSEYIFVAVEFDTYYNSQFDPNITNITHVGIDINSIRSTAYETWYADILDGSKDYYAKIDYNSSTHNLSVAFTGYTNGTQIDQHLSYQLDLRDYLPEWVMVGFSASTGANFEVHTLKSWSWHSTLQTKEKAASPTPTIADSGNPPPPPPKKRSKIGLWVGLGIGLSFFICFIGLSWFLKRKRRASSNEEEYISDLTMDNEFEKGTGPKKFSYKELMQATNNFAEEEKLGQGGFGGVYRGFMRDLDSYVAIKKVSRGSQQGIKEYATEVKVISQLRHKNLVQLIGWCHQKNDLLLIYEFMPNRSLDFHLFEEHNFLTWQVRYNIALGLASALLYLQELWEQCVLHRDIKSSNIMLDSNFNAKLGDFGLARLVDHGKGSQTTVAAGTMGYMAHECVITGKASKESDIFSFGVVALEIACGRKPINLRAKEGQVRMVEWVWELYGMGKLLDAADPKLRGKFDIQQMERLMVVGLWCAHPDYMLRPSIRQAIHVLNFEVPLPVLPEKMPVPTYLPPPSTASLSSLYTGANSFEIENNVTQSLKNSDYTSSSQFTSSSTGSDSATLLHTH